MARIRTIKPEFPQSESIGRISRDARLLFIELWTICDDEGRTRGSSRMLASLLFPYDEDAPNLIEGWLIELEREDCIQCYTVEGKSYIQVCNWLSHQKIDHASKSKIPPFSEPSRKVSSPREPSCEDLRTKEGTKDQGRGGKEAPDGVPPPGLPMLTYARGFLEECCIPVDPSLTQVVSSAIGAFSREHEIAANEATRQLSVLARDALARNETVNRFWFSDRKWTKGAASEQSGISLKKLREIVGS